MSRHMMLKEERGRGGRDAEQRALRGTQDGGPEVPNNRQAVRVGRVERGGRAAAVSPEWEAFRAAPGRLMGE